MSNDPLRQPVVNDLPSVIRAIADLYRQLRKLIGQGGGGTQGPKGDKGDTGSTGAKGATGPAGVKGDKGDTGATGATGPAGPKGDKGATGTVDTSNFYTSHQVDTLLVSKANLDGSSLTNATLSGFNFQPESLVQDVTIPAGTRLDLFGDFDVAATFDVEGTLEMRT